jgi:hypothetical protein
MKARLPGLQGLVTNDVAPLGDQHARPMYACILNAQGRFLHDLFMHRQSGKRASAAATQHAPASVQHKRESILSLQELGVSVQGAIRCCWQMWTERQPQTWSSCCVGKLVLHAHADALAMTSSDYKQPENDANSANPSPHRYKLRAKVDVAEISDEASVWVSFGPPAARQGMRCISFGNPVVILPALTDKPGERSAVSLCR